MKVYVICCNDSVEYAVVDNEKRAEELLKQRVDIAKENQYWHIHEVNGE